MIHIVRWFILERWYSMNLSTVSKINHHHQNKNRSKLLAHPIKNQRFFHSSTASTSRKIPNTDFLRFWYSVIIIFSHRLKIDSKKSIQKSQSQNHHSSQRLTTNDNHHHDQQQQQQEPSRQPNLQFSSPKLYCEPIGIFPFWAWTTDERCTMYYDESIKISRSSSSSWSYRIARSNGSVAADKVVASSNYTTSQEFVFR